MRTSSKLWHWRTTWASAVRPRREDALDRCLAADRGLQPQSPRPAHRHRVEQRYRTFPGLNLTFEVLEGQAARADKTAAAARPLLEAQVVDAADSVAYDTHDADDALEHGLLTIDELLTIPLWREASKRVGPELPGLDDKQRRRAILHELIDWQVDDLISQAQARLQEGEIASVGDVRRAPAGGRAERRAGREKIRTGRISGASRLPASRPAGHAAEGARHARADVRRLPHAPGAAARKLSCPRRDGGAAAHGRGLHCRHDGPLRRAGICAAVCPARPAAKTPIGTFYYCFRSGVTDAGALLRAFAVVYATARVTGVESVPAALCFGCGGASGRTAAPRRGVSTRIQPTFLTDGRGPLRDFTAPLLSGIHAGW